MNRRLLYNIIGYISTDVLPPFEQTHDLLIWCPFEHPWRVHIERGMWMDFIIILDPAINLPKSWFGIRQIGYFDIIAFKRFDKSFRNTVVS